MISYGHPVDTEGAALNMDPRRPLYAPLQTFVTGRAKFIRSNGITIRPVEDPPETMGGLLETSWNGVIQVDGNLPGVSVWSSPRAHYNWRLWHDYTHIVTAHGFDESGELLTARAQANELSDPIAAAIVYATAFGLNTMLRRFGRYPHDQRKFVVTALHSGLEQAVNIFSWELLK